MKLHSAVFLLCAVLIDTSVYGATFHVAKNHPSASDSNNGLAPTYTSDNRGPWKTLGKAGATAKAGDVVLVYDGDYRHEDVGYGRGVIPVQNSGRSASTMIRFVAASGQQPILNTLRIHNRAWVEIRGFTFISPAFSLPSNWTDMPQIVIDEPSVVIDPDEDWSTREQQVWRKFSTYMGMIHFFRSEYTNGVDIKNSTHIVVTKNTISLYAFGIQVRGISRNIVIENNDISYCMNGIFTWQPKPALSDSIIRHNFFHQNFESGIDVREDSQGVVIEDNLLEYSGMSRAIASNHPKEIQRRVVKLGEMG